ncbi:MAG TPA: hypothetical protein VGL81_03920 [Polyangiaceae bacterium]
MLALPLLLAGCASSPRHTDSARGVTSMQPVSLTMQEEGWTTLVQGDRAMRALVVYRDRARDAYVRDVVELQIARLRGRIDSLFEDLTAGAGHVVSEAAVRADVANLYRSMRAAAVTERQMQEPAPQRTPPP